MNGHNYFSILPFEMVVKILENVKNIKEKLRLRKVCRQFRDAISMTFNKGIDLSYTDIDDDGLECFRGIKNINLSRCRKVTDDGLQHLQGVHTISLRRCENISNFGLKHLRGVHTIDLSGCYWISDFGLQHLRGVHTINLSGCNWLSKFSLQHLRGAHTIILAGCNGITDADLQYLARPDKEFNNAEPLANSKEIPAKPVSPSVSTSLTGRSVHTIDLSGCLRITDAGLRHLQGVHTINLYECWNITDAGLQHLGARASPTGVGVHTINLTGCRKVTDVGLQHLQRVHTIDLYGCDKITKNGLQHLGASASPTGVGAHIINFVEHKGPRCGYYLPWIDDTTT